MDFNEIQYESLKNLINLEERLIQIVNLKKKISKTTCVMNRFVKKVRVDSILLESTQKLFILYYEPTRVENF